MVKPIAAIKTLEMDTPKKSESIHQGWQIATSLYRIDTEKTQSDRYQSPTEFEFENTQIPTRALSHRTGALKQSNS